MRDLIASRLSRRSLFGAAAVAVLAFCAAPIVAHAADTDDQAEWPQSYETSPQLSVKRESTPILSPETVSATEGAIQKYQDIVAKGGWNVVPGGGELANRFEGQSGGGAGAPASSCREISTRSRARAPSMIRSSRPQ